MKRILFAALLAAFAAVSYAASSPYNNEAGQQERHQPEVG